MIRGKVLLTEDQIAEKVLEMGDAISRDYEGKCPILVSVLKGGVVFLADLIRSISIPIEIDFMAVSSYGDSTKSSGVVRILEDLATSIENRHVIIVEDIVDTGLTLNYIRENLLTRKPATIKICSLLDKRARREVDLRLDYVGFEVPDQFVIGYGLDYAQKYRNLRCIMVPHQGELEESEES
jgi:hypoxanthine phosphoribosyltransferase